MSEQIQKEFDGWMSVREYTDAELRFMLYVKAGSVPECTAFHGGYTACQSLIRANIAECEKSLELYDECTIGYHAITETINALREVLGEI